VSEAVAFHVRRLTRADIPLMLEMSAMFGAAFNDVETHTKRPPSGGYLDRLLGNEEFVALAAVQAGEVVGGLIAYELVKYEQERSEFYIYDLAVREDVRRRGVATALIEEVQRIAAANGAEVVFVQADHGDDAAIALYSKLGRREDVIHFDIPAAGAVT
jgi:aminoglycoside 3-N-acetyltransferase I